MVLVRSENHVKRGHRGGEARPLGGIPHARQQLLEHDSGYYDPLVRLDEPGKQPCHGIWWSRWATPKCT